VGVHWSLARGFIAPTANFGYRVALEGGSMRFGQGEVVGLVRRRPHNDGLLFILSIYSLQFAVQYFDRLSNRRADRTHSLST
jgi:hypothetical protein